MVRAWVVPDGGKIGSRHALSALGMLALVAMAGISAVSCLDGSAEPIVRADAGAVVDGSADSGAAPEACDPNAPLPLYLRMGSASATADAIDYLFKVDNRTGADIALSSLAIRYYFTSEITSPQTSVYYAGTCCGESRVGFQSDVIVSVVAIPSADGADHAIDVTFAAGAGTLRAGDSVQIEVGYFAPNHAQTLDQSNDYSFAPSNIGTQAEWDQCPTACAQFESCRLTVTRDGARVWGSPP